MVSGAAARALGKIGDARAVEPLIQKVLGSQVAVESLGKIGDARAVEPLIQTLGSRHQIMRLFAARALKNNLKYIVDTPLAWTITRHLQRDITDEIDTDFFDSFAAAVARATELEVAQLQDDLPFPML